MNEKMPGGMDGILWVRKLLYMIALGIYSWKTYMYILYWADTPGLIHRLISYAELYLKGAGMILVALEVLIFGCMAARQIRVRQSGRPADDREQQYRKRYLLYILTGAAGFVLLCGKAHMFQLFFLVWTVRELETEKRMKACLAGSLVFCCIWLAAWLSGMLVPVTAEFSYGTFGAYGLFHPNVSARIILVTFLTWWYLYGQTRKILSLVLTILCMLCSAVLFGCRTAVVILLVFAFMIFLLRDAGSVRKWRERPAVWKGIQIVYTLLPVIFLIVSAVLGILIVRTSAEQHEIYFFRRFTEFVTAYREFGFSVLPRDLNAMGKGYFYMDNAFAWMIWEKGLYCAAGLLGWMCLAMNQIIRKRDRGLIILGFLLTLYAVTEKTLEFPLYIVILSCLGSFVSAEKRSTVQ